MEDLLTFLSGADVNAAEAHEALVAQGVTTVGDVQLLSDTDLKEVGIALGPRRRILKATSPPAVGSSHHLVVGQTTSPTASPATIATAAATAAAIAAAQAATTQASDAYQRGVLDSQRRIASREKELKGAALGAKVRVENAQMRLSLTDWLNRRAAGKPTCHYLLFALW